MKGMKLHIAWLWGLLFLMTACGDDDYNYPPVKLEFVTVKSGADGRIQTLIPDKGNALSVVEDYSGSTISADSEARVMSNYEVLPDGNAVKIYALQSVSVLTPQVRDNVKHDPVEVISIWLGGGYLNMILNIKLNNAKEHTLGIVEDLSDFDANGVVSMLLYHDANGDKEYYNRRAYVSVPLSKYVDSENPKKITVKFKYYTYNEDEPVEKYYEPGFEYTPNAN